MKFSNGTRVIAIEEHDGNFDIIRKRGTVINEIPNWHGCILIEFDERIRRGHNGEMEEGKNGHCWYIPPNKIRHENDKLRIE